MGSNIREFELALGALAGDVDDQVGKVHRAVALEILTGVVRMSPVDTGLFRGNWQVAAAEPAGPIERLDQTGAESIAAAQPVIAGVQPYSQTWIANLVDYAEALEHGHSQQAPQGMVAVTVERVRSIFG